MKALGQAKLVQTTNSTGATVKAWDLTPFGGTLLQLGLVNSPLPPEGTTVDRTLPNGRILRVEVASGGVFEVKASDPPPTVGATGGVPMKAAGFFAGPRAMALVAGVVVAWWMFGRRRRRA